MLCSVCISTALVASSNIKMLGFKQMALAMAIRCFCRQKQRIAIARAICLNPSILILDDATSAVDMQTEHSIQLALKEVMKNRTTFIVAHRISSLKHADEILVFNKGRIRERGTHHELLEKNGDHKLHSSANQYGEKRKRQNCFSIWFDIAQQPPHLSPVKRLFNDFI